MTDGLVRDIRLIREMRFPVFHGGIGPLDSKGRGKVMEIDVPVECGGVRVAPGDWIFGDVDGVVRDPRGLGRADDHAGPGEGRPRDDRARGAGRRRTACAPSSPGIRFCEAGFSERRPPPMRDALFHLRRDGKSSLQMQLREMLVSAILQGQIPAGSPLPSSRKLAETLDVARNTVALAYQDLVAEGFLVAHERRGYFVNGEILTGSVQAGRAPGRTATPGTCRQRCRTGLAAPLQGDAYAASGTS